MTFIPSGYFYSSSSYPLLLRGAPDYSIDTMSKFHSEAPQASASGGLAQGPYVAVEWILTCDPSDERHRIYQ